MSSLSASRCQLKRAALREKAPAFGRGSLNPIESYSRQVEEVVCTANAFIVRRPEHVRPVPAIDGVIKDVIRGRSIAVYRVCAVLAVNRVAPVATFDVIIALSAIDKVPII